MTSLFQEVVSTIKRLHCGYHIQNCIVLLCTVHHGTVTTVRVSIFYEEDTEGGQTKEELNGDMFLSRIEQTLLYKTNYNKNTVLP